LDFKKIKSIVADDVRPSRAAVLVRRPVSLDARRRFARAMDRWIDGSNRPTRVVV
jgi:hypothetical protein